MRRAERKVVIGVRRQAAGVNISRADAVRHLLSAGLENAESAAADAKKRKR